MSEAPERMVLQPCPTYGWEHPDRVKYPVPPAKEYIQADRIEELEAKLAKAITALYLIQNGRYGKMAAIARTTIKELTGETK